MCGIFLKILISVLLQLIVDVLQLVLDLSLGLFGSRDHHVLPLHVHLLFFAVFELQVEKLVHFKGRLFTLAA